MSDLLTFIDHGNGNWSLALAGRHVSWVTDTPDHEVRVSGATMLALLKESGAPDEVVQKYAGQLARRDEYERARAAENGP